MRYIKYVVFTFICMIFVPLVSYADCDYQREAELSRIASNVQINYTYEIAGALHRFYYDNIVLEENAEIRQERLTLIKAVKKILGLCFDIIGISKVERMWSEE